MKFLFLFISVIALGQKIYNKESIKDFQIKLNKNISVTQITLIGDSHTQAGFLSNKLKEKFHSKYGNAGRGIVFPYQLANSNAPNDIEAYSNQTWITFRNSYPQNIYNNMGVAGYVMANNAESIIEINLRNDDFEKVKVFGNPNLSTRKLYFLNSNNSLRDFVTKQSKVQSYTVQNETYAELAAKFYTTTTRLKQLNGNTIMNPKEGQSIRVENTSVSFNKDFEEKLQYLGTCSFEDGVLTFRYTEPTNKLLIKTDGKGDNFFYGFQLLKNVKNGVVLNSIGANGATYNDYLKYPLELEQIKSLNSDLIIVALGTNESLTSISKEAFKNSVSQLITRLRNGNASLPILLISPTNNKLSAAKIPQIVSWLFEVAREQNTAFLNMYETTGSNYFQKSLQQKKASTDGVHFLKDGYEEQADIIWNALMNDL